MRKLLAAAILIGSALAAAGCATVRPYEKEHLADPIMSFAGDAREAARETHWIEAREGSTGGTGSAGGGCACN